MNEITIQQSAFISEMKEMVRLAQYEALKAVNVQLLQLYWELGEGDCNHLITRVAQRVSQPEKHNLIPSKRLGALRNKENKPSIILIIKTR